ncbi:MAG: PIN domain-containing protein [Chthoniobacterales bacterium]|nr:PIN domain-containing protein [Chthoniobacterales bacterium]
MNVKTVNWLDSSAVLALFLAEPGFEIVRDFLAEAAKGSREVRVAQISLTEIAHSVCRDYDEATAREDIRLLRELAVIIDAPTDAQCLEAGLLRSRVKLSTADATIAIQAMAAGAELLHKDPEFESVPGLRQRSLPYKAKKERAPR